MQQGKHGRGLRQTQQSMKFNAPTAASLEVLSGGIYFIIYPSELSSSGIFV